jgi:hypothetical protein
MTTMRTPNARRSLRSAELNGIEHARLAHFVRAARASR